MIVSPFHALYKARLLMGYTASKDKLLPVFASSQIEAYPYQIDAAMFALRSPYLRGAILCDDGSLGKSYEAMLVVTQLWYEGHDHILLVVPTPLLGQWMQMVECCFSVPLWRIDTNECHEKYMAEGIANPFEQAGIILTTYDFAAERADVLQQVAWDIAVFEEAHHLRRIYAGKNQRAARIKDAVGDSFKLLLTATPMQNSIMDLYGLIGLIDPTVFPDEKVFYSRYFRKPENYEELAFRVSRYCYRTTRPQVEDYVKIPKRIPITAEYHLTDKEQRLYKMIETYLEQPEKAAFPKMERYDLALMLYRTFSSSSYAIAKTFRGIIKRLETLLDTAPSPAVQKELALFQRMLALAESIRENAKGKALQKALVEGFARLKGLGARKKVLIFTENRATQAYLYTLLNKGAYKGKVLLYHGENSRDYSVIQRFEQEAQIMIATDIAAEGFNLQFCSFVVNYDMPYNTLKMEQRIGRCHRQGQQSDVLILNFLNKDNFADVRMLELVNKRILQFDGIFGLADDLLGGFTDSLERDFGKLLAGARSKDEIEREYQRILTEHEAENTHLVKAAERSLYASFHREIAEDVTISPQYIKDKTEEINRDLWALTHYFLDGKQGYSCDDDTRTVHIGIQPQKVFTGAHLGRREYSMTDTSLPRSGRHTITGTLARNILREIVWIGVPERGTVQVDGEIEPCTIGFYRVTVRSRNSWLHRWHYDVLVGQTVSGKQLSEEECRRIMELPVSSFTKDGDTIGERDGTAKQPRPDQLDKLVDVQSYISRTLRETDTADREEIRRLTDSFSDRKAALQRKPDALRHSIRLAETGLGAAATRLEKLEAQKKLSLLQKELKQAEQSLFLDGMRLDLELEEKIKDISEKAKLTAKMKRQFVIQVTAHEGDLANEA